MLKLKLGETEEEVSIERAVEEKMIVLLIDDDGLWRILSTGTILKFTLMGFNPESTEMMTLSQTWGSNHPLEVLANVLAWSKKPWRGERLDSFEFRAFPTLGDFCEYRRKYLLKKLDAAIA